MKFDTPAQYGFGLTVPGLHHRKFYIAPRLRQVNNKNTSSDFYCDHSAKRTRCHLKPIRQVFCTSTMAVQTTAQTSHLTTGSKYYMDARQYTVFSPRTRTSTARMQLRDVIPGFLKARGIPHTDLWLLFQGCFHATQR